MIGIFDSGSGGLTVLKAVREVLPTCDVVYFGDIAHAPYGSRSQKELAGFVSQGLSLLRERGAERLISACNSASASIALSMYDAFGMEPGNIIEMVGPTVSYFKSTPERILLCATPATVDAGIYQNAFHMIGHDVEAVAIPELAAAIEFGESQEKQKAVIAQAFKGFDWGKYDVLILACTHYPLALSAFKSIVPEHVVIFDPAVAVAERAQKQFWPAEVRDAKTQFLISKDSKPFRDLVAQMFPDAANNIEVVAV
ncbi:MAG TPA: aspartate/glutamate racemase family protein [Candidatus Paceibacterota bacterium]|jgi:glutamate racemase|nr:aspartate/glutamate racemase family protein [Candidatus Paceibacterota bacterium]